MQDSQIYSQIYPFVLEIFLLCVDKFSPNLPRVVSINPTVMQSVAPMFQPPWAEAAASTGMPIKDTNNSVRIRFINNRLKSVHNWMKKI